MEGKCWVFRAVCLFQSCLIPVVYWYRSVRLPAAMSGIHGLATTFGRYVGAAISVSVDWL